MSSLSDLLTTSVTYWEYRAVESATGTITIDPTSSTTSTWVSGSTAAPVVVVEFHGEIDIPLTCDAIYWFNASDYRFAWGLIPVSIPVVPNPDIAGLGVSRMLGTCEDFKALTLHKIILSFIITAFLVLLVAITAYVGGFLPGHYLRRADRLVLHANSRNEDSRWRDIFESVTLSFSDQQLVTGLAILVAGYYEMFNNNLSVYHWNIVVYLAWMSSGVHISTLTLLKDVFNKQPTLRNIRVAGMLALLILLITAMWPLRRYYVTKEIPVRCLWGSRSLNFRQELLNYKFVNPEWTFSITTLLVAYVWKLSQLFSSSRGWVRRWLVARPQAATERLMRRALLSRRSKWLTRPAFFLLAYCHIIAVVCIEMADSFAAVLMYLFLVLPWGAFCILDARNQLDDDVKAGESKLTFGQLVPLFLLVLPGLSACGLFVSE